MTTDHDLEQRLRTVLAADAERLTTAGLTPVRIRAAADGSAGDGSAGDRAPGVVPAIPLSVRTAARRRIVRVVAVAASVAVIAAAAVGLAASRTGHSGGVGAPAPGASGHATPLPTTSAPSSIHSQPSSESPAAVGERFFRDQCTDPKAGIAVRPDPGASDTYGPTKVLGDGENSRDHWRSFYRVGKQYAFFGVCRWSISDPDTNDGEGSVTAFHKLSDVPGRSSAPFDWTTFPVDQVSTPQQLYFVGMVPGDTSAVDLLNPQGVSLGRIASPGQIVSPGTKLVGGIIVRGQVATAVCYDATGRQVARLRV